MGIVINTNVMALNVKRNCDIATTSMNTAIERLSTGYKINHAADDAAGLAISEKMLTQVNGTNVAKDNVSHGINLLQTAEGDLAAIQSELQRIRELYVQAANGTYATAERNMIRNEVLERMDEITRTAIVSKFSELHLLDGTTGSTLPLQVGPNSGEENVIDISAALQKMTATALNAKFTTNSINTSFASSKSASDFIQEIDKAIDKVSSSRSTTGMYQNRLEAALSSLEIRDENLQESLSSLRDADIATETTELTKQQILQQASSALLSQANATQSIALSLINSL